MIIMIEIFKDIINKPIEIHYDELINIPEIEICLIFNNKIKTTQFKHSLYYHIEGYFFDKNKLNIKPKSKCLFNFPKKTFDKELIRNETIIQHLSNNDYFELKVKIKRINKKTLNFIDYEIN